MQTLPWFSTSHYFALWLQIRVIRVQREFNGLTPISPVVFLKSTPSASVLSALFWAWIIATVWALPKLWESILLCFPASLYKCIDDPVPNGTLDVWRFKKTTTPESKDIWNLLYEISCRHPLLTSGTQSCTARGLLEDGCVSVWARGANQDVDILVRAGYCSAAAHFPLIEAVSAHCFLAHPERCGNC